MKDFIQHIEAAIEFLTKGSLRQSEKCFFYKMFVLLLFKAKNYPIIFGC